MKEKLIIGTAVITLIGLIYIDASLKSPETVAETQSSLPIPESVEVVNEEPILDLSEEGFSYAEPASLMNSCEMSEDDTSQLSFSEAFGYFRKCLGADSSFQWKGNFYTTLLESKMVIPIVDSIKVEDNDPSTEMSQNP